MASLADMRKIYGEFIIVLNALEQLDSTPVYLTMMEVMKQDIEERQAACIKFFAKPEIGEVNDRQM